ncbi:Macrolide export ATP-binding/permease protein MacB [Novipirellula aureliae]|uniref:Macrolide export ATP-binding/permease protein MacB n=1 Tax=Novipirellula aureliae TaxID=2527966 RepID=A0A5C6E5X5_9BACT|nr:FtsX-like permease family protein [Novipirellula aureliae]TWU43964.1 Macrolide export ATP-binding/permease protein MacB [Novipirellula aureliae]
MHFSSLIWKNLRRRPLRTTLTLVALASAIAAVVALLGIASNFKNSFADVYDSHGVDIVVSRQGSADRLSSSIDQSLAERIADVKGVAMASPMLLETVSLEDEGVYGIPAMGMPTDSWMMDNFQFEDGNLVNQDLGNQDLENRLWLGVHLADRLGIRAGQSVNLFDQPYLVAGVFTSRSTWENGSMLVPLSLLQELTGRAGQVTYVNVRVADGVNVRQVDEVISRIKAVDARLLPLATEEFVATDTRMQIASAMAWMTSVIAIMIGAIGTLNTMMTSVMERTAEIGILRAIGWSRRRVVAMILGESCLLAILASLLGCAAAAGLTWLLSQSPAVQGMLDSVIDPIVMMEGMMMGVGIGLFGAILPAWRAAQLLPAQAFRER